MNRKREPNQSAPSRVSSGIDLVIPALVASHLSFIMFKGVFARSAILQLKKNLEDLLNRDIFKTGKIFIDHEQPAAAIAAWRQRG